MHTLKVIDTTFLTMCPFDGQMMGKWTVTVKVPENVKQVAHQLFDELNKSKYPAEIVNFKIENGNCRPLWLPEKGNLQRNGILLAPKPRINNFRPSSKMTPNLIIQAITTIKKCI